MITRLLGSVTPWLLAVLIGIAVYAGMQARHYADQAAMAQARVARAEDRAAILLEHQRWQRQQLENLAQVLEARDAQLERDGELIDLVRQAARNLEANDEETAHWAEQPSPAAVDDWLRKLAERPADGTDPGDPEGTEPPADAPAGTDPDGEP